MSKREPPFRDDGERNCKRICLSRRAMTEQLTDWLNNQQLRRLITTRMQMNSDNSLYLSKDTLYNLWYSFGRASEEINSDDSDTESESEEEEDTKDFEKLEADKLHDDAAEAFNGFQEETKNKLVKQKPDRRLYADDPEQFPDPVEVDRVRKTSNLL